MPNENQNEEIIKYLSEIKGSINSLKERMTQQEERMNRLEDERKTVGAKEPVFFPEPANLASMPSPPPFISEFAPAPKPISSLEKKEGDLEERIGSKWFARVGIVALILGVSFFLKYAFDNNWIGPTGRVIIGIVAGIILLGLGEKFIRKYFVYGQIISGGGLVVLYLSIFAAFDFYQLIGQIPAFLFMILVTAIGIILSIRYNALALILLAIIGGFATPFLISTGQNKEAVLFSYVLLLDLAILTVSIFKKWRELNFAGFIGTAIAFGAWAGKFYTKEQLGLTIVFLTLFFLVYSVSSLIYNLVKKENSSGTEQILTILSATTYFAASYALLNPDYHLFMGFFTLILAIYYFLWAYLVKGLTPSDDKLYGFLAFLTIGFITLAIPIQFEKNIITIAWTIEAVILFYLGIKTNQETIKALGLTVFGLSLFRLLILDSRYPEGSFVIYNKVFFTFFFVIFIAYISAFLFKRFASEIEEGNKFLQTKQLIILFIIVANFLTIFVISREIIFYFENERQSLIKERDAKVAQMYPVQKQSMYNDPGIVKQNKEFTDKMSKLENKSSVSLSIFWLIYGIILMAIGIIGRYKAVRIGGIVLLLLAILKLFFYDLWSLGLLYRIISSISMGIVLLVISFAYQKYKDKIKQII